MPRRDSTPNKRASESKKTVTSVRRKYKQNVIKSRKILPGEQEHVINMVLVLKLAGYNNTQMARVIGISRNQVAQILDSPEVTERLVLLRSALPAAALELMEGYAIEAVQVVVDIMRSTPDDQIALKAAVEVLDRTGLPKVTKQERHNTEEELLTVTDDGLLEKLRDASPEVQEEAAVLVERLENLLAAKAEGEVVEEGEDA